MARTSAKTSGKTPPERAGAEAPLVTVTGERGRLVVIAANRAADVLRIAPSMPLADARALLPDLAVVEADPTGDAQALASLADWCGRYTPWTALDPNTAPGTGAIWLDITGCAHLFGGETALVEDLMARFARLGLAAQAACADTAGGAWAWARYRGPGDGPVLPSGAVRAALAGLPVAALRLKPALVETLDRLGLRRIGALYDLPRAALAARLGESVRRRIDQALGTLDEPLSPRRPVAPFAARLAFPEPVTLPADIAAALERLAGTLCARLEAEHLGARRVEFAIHRSDASTDRITAGTSRPVHDPRHLMRLIAPKLERLDPAGLDGHSGVELAVLSAPLVAAFEADQVAIPRLWPRLNQDPARVRAAGRTDGGLAPRSGGGSGGGPGLAALADRLAGRLGSANVLGLALIESHWPERAAVARPVLDGPPLSDVVPRAGLVRPLRLLGRPEPVEVTAAGLTSGPGPSGPPAAFRWRKLVHHVARSEGPERIAPEWWREIRMRAAEAPRDYYRIEDREGRRLWLFREGDAGDGDRWFLHGQFA